jgi:tetratricopeptide (TPR) repeat protein
MKSIKTCLYILLTLIICTKQLAAQSNLEQKVINIHTNWLEEALFLTKNCVGFSAPVSSRALAYLTVGMYESSLELMDSLISLDGQLNNYKREVWKEDKETFNWELVANSADYTLINYLYRNMPPRNLKRIEQKNDSILDVLNVIDSSSVHYGKKIADEIIAWSKLDKGENGFNENFPKDYIAPRCHSCWSKTTPNYLSALLPTWGENLNLIRGSQYFVSECQVLPFSTDTSSALYKDALGIVNLSKSLKPEYEIIAEYWNDAPGYSGTPAGHFFSIALQLSKEYELTPKEVLICYAKLGVALNESNIHSWKLKYKYNFIRPITYIHKYIDPQFNSFIPTPPFPEFPSGHSFQSGTGSEVLISIFGENISFTDSTNIYRTDINGTPRHYNSISEMAEEISISRYYGGIHFRETLNISLDYGRRLGRYITNSIRCRR